MRKGALVAVAVLAAMLTAACSSSSGSSTSSGGASSSTSSAPIKLGVLTSLTGPAAAGFAGVESGVKARLDLQNAQGGIGGRKLSYVMEDDTTSPTGAGTAVKKAIEQDHVFALLDISAFFYGGYQAATQAKLPVVGVSFDGGPEWLAHSANPTMFDFDGGADYTKAATTVGLALKVMGVTKLATIGGVSNPSQQEGAEAAQASAKAAGIAAGYFAALAIGSTDVGPWVIGVKSTNSDGAYFPTQPNTAFAAIAGLGQAGVKMKGIYLATGYGGDLLASKPAVAAGQGAYFQSIAEPVEMHTAATQNLQAALKTYAAYTGVPTFSMYQGWLAADAFIWGMEHAGQNATQADFVKYMNSGAGWNAGGLYPRPVIFSTPGTVGASVGPGNCVYLPQLKGNGFVINPALNPVCGALIPGVTLSP